MSRARPPSHPGEILESEFLVPLGISQTTLARAVKVKPGRVNELVRGKRGITPETAWMLAGALRTSPEFWMNLQTAFDLARARPRALIRRISTNGAANGDRR